MKYVVELYKNVILEVEAASEAEAIEDAESQIEDLNWNDGPPLSRVTAAE